MKMGFAPSEEQQLLRSSVKDMLKKFESRREEMHREILKEKKFPHELWDALSEIGLMGCLVPEEYGGNGMGLLALTMGVEELGRQGFGNALIVVTNMDAACILRNGTEEAKKKWLPEIASGKSKFAFALTEPDAGSNTFRINTIASKNGSGYKVNGQKVFITGADVADQMLLVCRTTSYDQVQKDGMPKAYGLTLFVVDTKAKGIKMQPIPTRGIEGMTQWTLFFDDVHVPEENLIGQIDQGSMALFNSLNPERILAAATGLGMADFLIEKAVNYAKERKVFKDRPIGSYQGISHPLADIKAQVEAARLMTYKAAWLFDQDEHPGVIGSQANMAKYLAAEAAIKACDQAIETLGGYGFSEEYGIIYFWEAARLLRTAPITKEMILNYIAEHVLGLPRTY
jgi:alkylation response protein AidB-like acyl-CoA dehydrogenase